MSSARAIPPRALRPVAALGQLLLSLLHATGRVVSLIGVGVSAAVSSRAGLNAAVRATLSLCARCAIPVALIVGAVGALLALQTLLLMRQFGLERQLAPLVVATIVREIGPGFAAVAVAMQGGAGIAAELGAMRLRDELDAIDAMGLDAQREIAGPRVIGAALAAPLLNILAIAAAIFSAWLVSVVGMGVPHHLFIETAPEGLVPLDVWVSEGKCVIFGVALGSVCADAGFYAERGPAGVGRAANRAVVTAVILVLVLNYLFNTALYGLRATGRL